MDPEKKSLNSIFPTKYVIPKSLATGQISFLPPTKTLPVLKFSETLDFQKKQLPGPISGGTDVTWVNIKNV